MKKLLENLRKQIREDQKRKRRVNVFTGISALVVFVIVYVLILPAIAMDEETYCGLDAHEHSDSCYEQVLICQEEEHEHTDQCYDQEGNLVCDKDEHTHDDSCYKMELVCSKERHIHGKACYEKPTPEEVTENTAAITNTSVSKVSKSEVSSDDENVYIPDEGAVTEPVDLSALLTDRTGIWHQLSTEPGTDSQSWEQINQNAILMEDELLRIHLAFQLPKDSVLSEDAEAYYNLPANVVIPYDTAAWLNDDANGINQLITGTASPEQTSVTPEYLAGRYKLGQKEDGSWQLAVTWDPYVIVENGKSTINVWTDLYVSAASLFPAYDGKNKVIFRDAAEEADQIVTYYKEISIAEAGEKDAGNPEGNNPASNDGTESVSETETSAEEETSQAADTDTDTEKEQKSEEEKTETPDKAEEKDQTDETDKDDETKNINESNKTDESNQSEKSEDTDEEDESSVSDKISQMSYTGTDYTVNVSYGEDAGIPEGAELKVKEILEGQKNYKDYYDQTMDKLGLDSTAENEPEDENKSVIEKVWDAITGFAESITGKDTDEGNYARIFDIEIWADGQKIEPENDVTVNIKLQDVPEEDDATLKVVHFTKEGPEVVEATETVETGNEKGIQFVTDEFSVYSVVYTVDFHWEVDGRMYDFSLPGGGFISFSDLIEVLGVAKTGENEENEDQNSGEDGIYLPGEVPGINDQDINGENSDELAREVGNEGIRDNIQVSEDTWEFVRDVEKVEFSNTTLVDVSKVESETTVGQIKEDRGLEVQYSANLTEEQIAEINAQTVEAGDWALISMLPFESTESLTVTMKTGEVFEIRVTDYQISTNVLTADGKTYKITVIYDDDAEIPAQSYLKAEEILSDSELYDELLSNSSVALNVPEKDIEHIRFFNITIINGEEIIEPKKAVTVEIRYEDPVSYDGSQDFDVIHFGSEGTDVFSPVVTVNEENQTAQEFIFQTESFSTFAIASIPSRIEELIGNEYVLFIQPGTQGAVLSPENQTGYTNRLSAIPATSTGTSITADVDQLPAWTITNGSQNGTYRLSTTYNNQTVYINITGNQNGDNNDGRLRVSTTPQDLRIRTRVGGNGGTQFRFTYNADYNAVSIDLFGGNPSNGFAVYNGGDNNNNEYFTLYAVEELPPNKVTVHFVDRTGTLLTDVQYTGNNSYVTKNEDGTFTILNDWEGTTGTISLENDFGLTRYTYANTHLAKNTTVEWPTVSHNYTYDGIIIEPTLTSTGHALQFKTDIGASGTGQGQVSSHDFVETFNAAPPNDNNKEYASEGDKDVYVILDPIPTTSGTGSTGSTGGSGGSGNNDFSNSDPVFHKDLTNNYDGTYELSLSVVGKALNESETPKVNVLLVVDTSSSMTNNNVTYVDENGRSAYGTRLAATQVELKQLGDQLLERNDLTNNSTLDDDIVEVAMVTFDGNAYDNTLDWTTSDNVYESAVNGLQTHRGTNWEDALDAALIKAIAKKTAQPNEPVYVLFFTDGEPSQYSSFHYTSHTSDYGWRYFFAQYGKEASKDEARAIVNNGIQFYTMFAFGPSGNNQTTYYGDTQFQLLHKLVQYAYNTDADLENKRAFNATNSTLLNSAFNAILQEINSSLGITDVVMNDSFTNLTVAGVNIRGNETDTGGFRYWKIPSGGTWEDRVAWDEAPPATYDAATGVQWDLSSITLENNVTYVVTFTVWPSQAAYDWVADLKNGVKTWDDAIEAGLANTVLYRVDDGNGGYTYEVQTNPQSTVPGDGSVGTNGITYTKTTEQTVKEKGNDAGTRTYTTEDPDTYVKETTTYTQNEDGTWTKTVVSETITAFNMPDKRMALSNTGFYVDKFWDVNGKLTELHNFLYHKDDDTGEWVSNQKQIIFKIAKGYDQEGNPAPYDKFGTDGLPLGWQADESEYDWTGATTSIEGHTIGTRWREDLDISFGLMLTHEKAVERGLDLNNTDYLRTTYQGVTYYLLDYGWDYAIDEVYGLNYQFDFRSSVYHPMLIDGQPAHVKFTVENGVWTITEMTKDLTALTGNNILRGDLRVQKELQDVNGNRIRDDDTTTFDFTVNLVNEDYVFIPDEGVETVPWYGVSKTTIENGETVTQYYFYQYAPDGVFDHYATEAEATVSDEYGNLTLKPGYRGNIMQHGGASSTVIYDGVEYTGYTQASATLYVKAEEDWSIANIPLGTRVTVSEPDKPGYVFVDAKRDGNNLETTYSDNTHTTASCEIPAGRTTTIKITNKEQPIDLLIFKAALIDNQDVLLEGAEFNLHKWDEERETWLNVSGVTNPFAVNKNTGYQIQAIKPGLYKLHETKTPDGYIVTQDTYFKVVDCQIILCDEDGNTMVGSGDEAMPYENEMAKIETTDNVTKIKLTVYNTPGAALPNTGGPGTRLFTILGSIVLLLGGSVWILYRKSNLV